ncbi:50S ribosomal protein L20 [Candidatus Campbellbacteria bacterium CG11_big_fil_rev_8_21_14_0_20_44_21]|uniref:Large ribosomal subunit protein bL20 n=1 Tax=Candidatus Campbellbacteria bacterium CG22_combo_CG10-13_8_21_14_all_43_18 TaxID=1974530 RepID=A0A2H0DWI6_9BACT|nr:MAG: 50S ribosomal protein L20 [Candidatus Campbellbacteria bacterium CG22_combo_CG10-13_8_21_14_all_43_18]PIR24357.1 MAG: 50S ribosomal protein L20 [Candidatus Campbellbacteria bacterium CG11_big_fil_rev_8_21_14_0_20_44_21]
MTRVKRGVIKNKRRKNILAKTKGYRNAKKSKKRQAKEAIFHAGTHAFNDRRKKKNDFRRLWQVRIGAALKPHDLSYSKFIKALKDKKIEIDRKILSELAKDNPETFSRIVEEVK